MRRRHPAVVLATILVTLGLATGCGSKGSDTGGSSGGSENVTVPVAKKDGDRSYVADSTAVVTNEEYSEGMLGTVKVSAKTASTNPDSNMHWLSGRIVLKSGGTVECSEPRSHVWSDFGVFEDIPMTCDRELPLKDVASYELNAP